MSITRAQLGRLQTVYAHCVRRCLGYNEGRDARLAWANERLQLPAERRVASFSGLTEHQARILIDAAQADLGTRAPLKPGRRARQKLTTTAQRAGNDGRVTDTTYLNQPEMVSAEDLEVIASYYARLGWTADRFAAWIASSYSPIKPSRTIRTVKQANRIRWALKNMLQDAGLWEEWSKS